MVQDHFHIEMEDISAFHIERTVDHSFWEEIPYEELMGKILAGIQEEKLKRFFGVVRNGGTFKLGDYFYRIKTD